MRPFAPVLFLLLGACAALGPDPLPVCDGQTRRPANPHGSVLSPPDDRGPAIAAPASTAAPAGPAGPAEADEAASSPFNLPAGGCL